MKLICYAEEEARSMAVARVALELAARTQDGVVLAQAEGPAERRIGAWCELLTMAGGERDTEARRAQMERSASPGVQVEDVTLRRHGVGTSVARLALPSGARLVLVSAPTNTAFGLRSSAAEDIAEESPVPTLAIRDPEPLLSWIRQERALRVLCAYDFTATSEAGLAYLAELQRIGPCEITVFHACQLAQERARQGIVTPMRLEGDEKQVEENLRLALVRKVEELLGRDVAIAFKFAGTWGRTDSELMHGIQHETADLLVIGTHQRHGFDRLLHGSTARAVMRKAPMSLLVVPPTSIRATAPGDAVASQCTS